jgi:hypothetical protein
MKYKILITALAATLALSSARGNDAMLDLLIKKGVITQREANEIREQMDAQMAQTVELHSKGKFASWLDNVKFSGDFRLRAENFIFEDYQNNSDRLRFRYRLRLQMDFDFHDWAKVTMRLASGEASPGDPVSTNQSFTDTFKKKPLTIDAAYVTIQPPGWDWIKVMGGKMDMPIWQPKFNSPMMYDFDLTPEGVAEQLQYTFGDKGQYRVFGQFGQFILDEINTTAAGSKGSNSRDPFMLDFQAGIEAGFGGDLPKKPKFKVTAAAGYMMTHNVNNIDYTPFTDSPNKGNANGSLSYTNNPVADFNVIYGRGELAYLITEKLFLGTPALVTLSGEMDHNLKGNYETLIGAGQSVDKYQTSAWTIQLAFGEAKKKGQWQVAYQYKHLEADAVWDALTDSDWGTGGTDRKGHVVKGVYNLTDWWQFGCTVFLTEKISNRANSGHNTVGGITPFHGQDMLRLQLDSVFKF